MADDDEPTFESADSEAGPTYLQQAGEIRKGSYVMIKGSACKCVDVPTAKTGGSKHGTAEAHIVAIDIFTGTKLEEHCPTSQNLEVPRVKIVEYQCLTADGDSGEVSLLLETGETKDDLHLPTFTTSGQPSDDDKKLSDQIVAEMEKGEKSVYCIVISAVGKEKINGIKLV